MIYLFNSSTVIVIVFKNGTNKNHKIEALINFKGQKISIPRFNAEIVNEYADRRKRNNNNHNCFLSNKNIGGLIRKYTKRTTIPISIKYNFPEKTIIKIKKNIIFISVYSKNKI
tara:strand:+ start:2448 stop:2789 length:342 start_codon:yes stop_codon:yes gene_type:complete